MIVTNNPLVKNPDVFVDGDFRDVLLKVRDLVFEGYELETHPLFASIRMMFSPVRTVILKDEPHAPNENLASSNTITQAIELYDNTMGNRRPDMVHKDDYAMIDHELFLSALQELNKLNIHGGEWS